MSALDGASHNLIGGHARDLVEFDAGIAGNNGSGIVIRDAGPRFNTINGTSVGSFSPITSPEPVDATNGQHGIRIHTGVSDNILGGSNTLLKLRVDAALDGALVLMEGFGTDRNILTGGSIGIPTNGSFIADSPKAVRDGVVLQNGHKAIRVGRPRARVHGKDFAASWDASN